MPPSDYGKRLERARKKAGLSKRALAQLFAERAELNAEGARRAIYKYEDEGKEPEQARAAILAVILNEPQLALVSSPKERRGRARLEELEDRVDAIERVVGTIEQRLFGEGVLPDA